MFAYASTIVAGECAWGDGRGDGDVDIECEGGNGDWDEDGDEHETNLTWIKTSGIPTLGLCDEGKPVKPAAESEPETAAKLL